MGKIIALAAGKGGTGKTLLTAALGERLAARGGVPIGRLCRPARIGS